MHIDFFGFCFNKLELKIEVFFKKNKKKTNAASYSSGDIAAFSAIM